MTEWQIALQQIHRVAPPPPPLAEEDAPTILPATTHPPAISTAAANASRRALARAKAKRTAQTLAREGDLRQRLRDLIAARPGLYFPAIAFLIGEETPGVSKARVYKVLQEIVTEFRRTGARSHYRYYPRES